MNVAFDLSSLQDDLKKLPKFKELNKAISRYTSARSLQRDLESALSSLDYLSAIDVSDGATRTAVGQPLMTHAVMLYCRAAIEDGSGRFPMGVTKRFSKEQATKHQDVVKLRNKTMAHFGVGEGAYGAEWTIEKAVLKSVDNEARITDVWTRANYLAALIADLSDLCETALSTVQEVVRVRLDELSELLFKTTAKDSDLLGLIRKHPFDPFSFFSSPESAASFWSGGHYVREVYTPKMITEENSIEIGVTVATAI